MLAARNEYCSSNDEGLQWSLKSSFILKFSYLADWLENGGIRISEVLESTVGIPPHFNINRMNFEQMKPDEVSSSKRYMVITGLVYFEINMMNGLFLRLRKK